MSPLARRLAWAAILASSASVLALAWTLEPDARGHGTHEQLGLPGCGFLSLTGAPCPGCGLTTAFAHLARAELGPAIASNAAALPLFALTVLAAPFALVGAWRASPLEPILASRATVRISLLVVAALLLSWLLRVCPA